MMMMMILMMPFSKDVKTVLNRKTYVEPCCHIQFYAVSLLVISIGKIGELIITGLFLS